MWNSVIIFMRARAANRHRRLIAREPGSPAFTRSGPDLALYDRLVTYWCDHSIIFGATTGARAVSERSDESVRARAVA
jgi:hypothetical protein